MLEDGHLVDGVGDGASAHKHPEVFVDREAWEHAPALGNEAQPRASPQGSAPILQDLPGRVSAYQVSDVRPQVSGVILRRLFREGSIVRQGQTLYQIDPSIYSAQAAQAAANLQSARASAEAARTLAARYAPLVR